MIKMDLHVHSSYSRRPSQRLLQKINGPKHLTRPMQLYRIAMNKGMSHVTFTDHNAIEGARSIAHLPGTFISEEITTRFPEDGCKVHVLAYRITESQHEDIQRCRQSIYELADYLNRENIFHAVAHPLYAVNDRLTMDHVEKMMLLFKNFEINGSRNVRQNEFLEFALFRVTEKAMDILSEKHRITPVLNEIWKKNLVGGSDDHIGFNVAGTFTQVLGTSDLDEAFRHIQSQRSEVIGKMSKHPGVDHHGSVGPARSFVEAFSRSGKMIRKFRNEIICTHM